MSKLETTEQSTTEKPVVDTAKEDTLTLRHPIDIDGEKVSKLTYDFEAITAKGIAAIESRIRKVTSGTPSTELQEFDKLFHLYMFLQAVIEKNPKYDMLELEKIKGKDAMSAMRLGRNFTLGSGGGAEETSDEQ